MSEMSHSEKVELGAALADMPMAEIKSYVAWHVDSPDVIVSVLLALCDKIAALERAIGQQ